MAKSDVKRLRQLLRVKFTPRMRNEAASALAAWDAWSSGETELSALSVYLIASHHGIVRTALRSTWETDEVFGLRAGDALPPVPPCFSSPVAMHFEAKHLGAHGTWNDNGTAFDMDGPSWVEVVADLLGSATHGAGFNGGAIPKNEPKNLGPFLLAFLEALLVAADIRASNARVRQK